jgi:aryl-alcohol dehydrogenase-like predicted oxidoreductase
VELRQLGSSDLWITPIGIGGWAMGGGDWKFALGPQDDGESVATIRRAIELGVNWIDTAALYGLGHSEEVVGRALDGVSPKPLIFTKCSRIWDERGVISSCLRRKSVRREAEASLKRLKVEQIDLYQMHWPWPDEGIEEGWTAMAELKKEGKVRWIGVSNFNVAQMQRVEAIAPVTALQPPYSMLVREAERALLPYATAKGIGVIVYSPLRNGLLCGSMTRQRIAGFPSNDCRRNLADFQEPRLSRNLEFVEVVRQIASGHGRTPGEIAVAWALRQPAVTGAIVGARTPGQIDSLVNAASFRWSEQELEEIELFLERRLDADFAAGLTALELAVVPPAEKTPATVETR